MSAELRFVVQLALGIVFLVSTASKAFDPRGFARGVADYEMLPPWLVSPASCLIIVLEGWSAVAHITGWLLMIAMPIGVALFVSFAAAVSSNLRRGRAVACHCFGSHGEAISSHTLGRLILLIGCETYLLTRHRPVYLQEVALQEIGLALFWATFSLLVALWLVSCVDVGRLLRSMR